MDYFFDEAARILATRMPRRKAFRLIGGALAAAAVAAFGVQPVHAAKCNNQSPPNSFTCGTGSAQVCCPPNTCCASNGKVASCCGKGTCVGSNGTCAASTGGHCTAGTIC